MTPPDDAMREKEAERLRRNHPLATLDGVFLVYLLATSKDMNKTGKAIRRALKESKHET